MASFAGYAHLRSYRAYEQLFENKFHIIEKYPVGFFVPHLWKLPMARALQKSIESCMRAIVPRLAHEYIYVLKKR